MPEITQSRSETFKALQKTYADTHEINAYMNATASNSCAMMSSMNVTAWFTFANIIYTTGTARNRHQNVPSMTPAAWNVRKMNPYMNQKA